jgi:hypothetical protein
VLIREIRGSKFPVSDFSAEGPVLQARGLPKGDLIKALLTNWSIVPHACLFRRSILERAGGFPEDIWVGEDQLLFLRCLLAAAKVVHTPETLVLYRLGEEGKLTESKEGHVRRVTHWARFLVKASQEVGAHAEARRRGDFVLTTEDTENTEVTAGQRLDKPSCAAFSNLSTSALARDSENTSPSRCASGPAEEALRVDYMGSGSAGGNQLADSKEFLKGQSQAGLQIDNQKDPTIRTANDPSASGEYSSSVSIRDIRGQNSDALDAVDVVFYGPAFGKDKDALLRSADAFILPSFSEGLPMSVLEAWSYGLPVVMTLECNLPEGFASDAALEIRSGEGSFKGSDFSFQHGLRALLEMSRAERGSMGMRGRRLVEDRFTWPKVAEQMKEVYESLL